MTYVDDLIDHARRRSMTSPSAIDGALLQRLCDALVDAMAGRTPTDPHTVDRLVHGVFHRPDEALFVADHRAGLHDTRTGNWFCVLCQGLTPLPENDALPERPAA